MARSTNYLKVSLLILYLITHTFV